MVLRRSRARAGRITEVRLAQRATYTARGGLVTPRFVDQLQDIGRIALDRPAVIRAAQAIRTGRMHEFRRHYREGTDVLLLGGVQFLAGNEGT